MGAAKARATVVETPSQEKPTAATLRRVLTKALEAQGFLVDGERIQLPTDLDKEKLRSIHSLAVEHRIEKARKGLQSHESRLLERFATGSQVDAEQVAPRLVEVRPDSDDELLFRYASLHWSIPVSSGYGRRLRFLVVDEQNEKLIGLVGLGDPVFNLGGRDKWIGWDRSARRANLQHVMDAFVLGAVPPYSFLLCGKLVAMLAASNEVRHAFKRKYRGRQSLIREQQHDARLALITTTSALGRSSIYNRLKIGQRLLYERVGFTRGSGEFHFSNGLYGMISAYAEAHCEATAKQERWGSGFRNRREVIKKCLTAVRLPKQWLYHGIQREIYVVPLARNSRQFLRGQHTRLLWHDQPADELFAFFRERWLLPRSRRDKGYIAWSPNTWRIWGESDDA